MLSDSSGLIILQKAADHLRGYSIKGAMGPALAGLVEYPSCPERLHEVQECHWVLMQGVSQLLDLKQGMLIGRDHPVIGYGRTLANQAEQLNCLWNKGISQRINEYTFLAMMLDETIEDFFFSSCEL